MICAKHWMRTQPLDFSIKSCTFPSKVINSHQRFISQQNMNWSTVYWYIPTSYGQLSIRFKMTMKHLHRPLCCTKGPRNAQLTAIGWNKSTMSKLDNTSPLEDFHHNDALYVCVCNILLYHDTLVYNKCSLLSNKQHRYGHSSQRVYHQLCFLVTPRSASTVLSVSPKRRQACEYQSLNQVVNSIMVATIHCHY